MLTKLKIYAILMLVAIFGFGVSYIKGRNDGQDLMELEILKERQKWEQVIDDNQTKYNNSINEINKSYSIQIHDLKTQVKTLKDNPKIITKYIKEENQPLSNGFVIFHDRLVDQVPLNGFLPEDVNTTSKYNQYDLCNVLSTNYFRCNECMIKLNALQQIVKEYQSSQSKIK